MTYECRSCGKTFTTQVSQDPSSTLTTIIKCPHCSTKVHQCNYCTQSYVIKTKKKRLQEHALKFHPEEHQSFLDHQNNPPISNNPPIIFDFMENGDYDDVNNVDAFYDHDDDFDDDDDDDDFVTELLNMDVPSLDIQDTSDVVNTNYDYEPPPHGLQCMSLEQYNYFATPTSNTYYWQDLATKNEGQGEFGGLRGIAWRSVHKQGVYDSNSVATLGDTTLLFSFMDHMIESPHRLRYGFMRCIREVLCRVEKLNVNVEVPTNLTKARSILLEGAYGMFGNLPHPAVHERDGHACISLKDLLKHVCAMKVPIAFTESPNSDGSANPIRITT